MRKEPMKIGDLLKKYNLLVLLIVFIVIASILSPNFLTVGNVLNLLQQASIPGIVAIGMTLVIIISGIDLSVGSVAAFAGMISAILVSKNVPIIIAVLAGVVLGAALGLVTGILIAKFGLPDFIASLAMMEIARGAALLTTQGVPVFGLSNDFKFIGGASLSGGIGSMLGTFGGVFLLQIITNIFNLVGLASFYQQIAKGIIIIAALLLNRAIDAKK